MKNKRIILGLALLFAGGLMFSSCTKNDENTIVLIGTEYYVDDILSVIPDTLQTRFFADFGTIHEGPIPPKIEGSYVVDPKQRVASNMPNWALQSVEPNVYLRFSGQHNGIVKMDLNEATETITDTVFIYGQGNNFTVYFIENKSFGIDIGNVTYHVTMQRGILMKGQVTDTGLKDFRMATIVMKTEDDSNGLIEQYPNGSYFIYKDGNSNAERHDW